ncbi:DUF4372 domain-containing protein [Halanaerobium saccharolyticum]|uniref:DUF4372 domain-containing protein n=1 Tax=Halanaerobium saccharolyticum TaxID=43595 RepID=UPI000DBABAC9
MNFNLFSKIVTELELDKYTKKLTTKKLFQILLYGQLESVSSLGSLSIDVSNKYNLQAVQTSFSASNTSTTLAVYNITIILKTICCIRITGVLKNI